MQTQLISIGNSKGIRLPKALIQQFGFDINDIMLTVKENGILISAKPMVAPLEQWDALFVEAKKNGFNAKEDRESFSDWDTTLNDGLDGL